MTHLNMLIGTLLSGCTVRRILAQITKKYIYMSLNDIATFRRRNAILFIPSFTLYHPVVMFVKKSIEKASADRAEPKYTHKYKQLPQ